MPSAPDATFPPRPIALLSDFGTSDPYVGQVKAVIARMAPGSPCIDLTHDIPPQDVAAGSFALSAVLPYLPGDPVVWAVVDPGVGTQRAAIAVEARARGTGGRLRFVAPDNGLLTEALERLDVATVARLDDPAFHLPDVGATFHGRDLFAPVAAHLARGEEVRRLGTPFDGDSLVRLEITRAARTGNGWRGRVRWVDRFGNLITDLPARAAAERRWWLRAGDASVVGPASTFGSVDSGEGVAYVGSWGTVELAVRDGSAAARWNLGIGDAVELAYG